MTLKHPPTKYYQCRLVKIHALNSLQDVLAEERHSNDHSPLKRPAQAFDVEMPPKRPFHFEVGSDVGKVASGSDVGNVASGSNVSNVAPGSDVGNVAMNEADSTDVHVDSIMQ